MANFVMFKRRFVQTSLCGNFVMSKLRYVQKYAQYCNWIFIMHVVSHTLLLVNLSIKQNRSRSNKEHFKESWPCFAHSTIFGPKSDA